MLFFCRHLPVALVMGCGFLLAPLATQARDLRFVTIDVAPWAWVETGQTAPTGVFVDVVHELEKRTGRKIVMALQPFARIPHELEARRADCTILVWNNDWGRFMDKGEVVSTHMFGVIARKGIPLKRFDDLAGLNVSVLRGLSLGRKFDSDTSFTRQVDTDYVMGLNKLAHQRLDAVAGALPTIRYLARQNNLTDMLGDQFTLSEVILPLQCVRGSDEVTAAMTEFNQTIRAMRDDGTIDAIKKHYDY